MLLTTKAKFKVNSSIKRHVGAIADDEKSKMNIEISTSVFNKINRSSSHVSIFVKKKKTVSYKQNYWDASDERKMNLKKLLL